MYPQPNTDSHKIDDILNQEDPPLSDEVAKEVLEEHLNESNDVKVSVSLDHTGLTPTGGKISISGKF